MENNEFSVYWYDALGNQNEEMRFVSAEVAFQRAKDLIKPSRPINIIGGISRLIITDGSDSINFEWEKGRGITFPPKEDVYPSKD